MNLSKTSVSKKKKYIILLFFFILVIIAILIIFLLLKSRNNKVQYNDNLTLENEILIFSFIDKNTNQVVSLLENDIDSLEDYMVVRVGTKDNVILEFPDNKENSWEKFAYKYYFRGGGKDNCGTDDNHILFEDDTNSYDLYQIYTAEDDEWVAGLDVTDKVTGVIVQEYEAIPESITGDLIDFRWGQRLKIIYG